MLKLKFVRNRATLDVTNNTPQTVIFDPKEMIGILDLRSLGYYKIKKGVLPYLTMVSMIFSPNNLQHTTLSPGYEDTPLHNRCLLSIL